jgi:hypothetical protein
MQNFNQAPNPYANPYPGYPYGYEDYYYGDQSSIGISEKSSATLFFVGYFILLFGGVVGIYFFTVNNPILLIIMILLFTFGISSLTFGATALWAIEKWQTRILNLLTVTLPIEFYLLFYSAQSSELSLSDLGTWLVIIITFLIIAYFGTFIPIKNRIQILCTLGVVMIINAPIAFIMVDLEIYQTGFWVLVGLVCSYIGYNLTSDSEDVSIENMYTGTLYGLGVGILFAVLILTFYFDFNDLSGIEYLIFAILGFWCLVALLLLYYANNTTTEMIVDMINSFKIAFPAFIGILLIFFSIYLIRAEKVIESVIELFLGLVLIGYTGKQLKKQKSKDLFFIVIAFISFSISLGYLLVV